METDETRGELKIPRFEGDALKFAETMMALEMPYRLAIDIFSSRFPEYAVHDELTDGEIRKVLQDRFSRMHRDKRRPSHQNVKEKQEILNQCLDCIPVANPFVRLMKLEVLSNDPDLKPTELLKVLDTARKEVEVLKPRERRPATFGLGMGLPDLYPKPNEDGEIPPDPFGGAIGDAIRRGKAMKQNNANTGQETSEDEDS